MIEPYPVLPLQVTVNLRNNGKEGVTSTFPRVPEWDPHHELKFKVVTRR